MGEITGIHRIVEIGYPRSRAERENDSHFYGKNEDTRFYHGIFYINGNKEKVSCLIRCDESEINRKRYITPNNGNRVNLRVKVVDSLVNYEGAIKQYLINTNKKK